MPAQPLLHEIIFKHLKNKKEMLLFCLFINNEKEKVDVETFIG